MADCLLVVEEDDFNIAVVEVVREMERGGGGEGKGEGEGSYRQVSVKGPVGKRGLDSAVIKVPVRRQGRSLDETVKLSATLASKP